MFASKSFNLSGILSRSKPESRQSSVLEPKDEQKTTLRQQIQKLTHQNNELKQQLQNLKELFIQARIDHDTQIRASDQLIEQLRNELSQKQTIIQKYLNTLKEQQRIACDRILQADDQNDEDNRRMPEECQENLDNNKNDISELMLQSSISFRQMYEESLQQVEALKIECEKLRHELSNSCQKTQTMNTNDVSFTGKGESKISFDFGDITGQLRDVQEIAEFSNERTQITVDQQQINVRDERIENLERQNIQLQHQLASKSHKLATIFNAAYEFGGMHLLDHLQNSIGLIEAKFDDTE